MDISNSGLSGGFQTGVESRDLGVGIGEVQVAEFTQVRSMCCSGSRILDYPVLYLVDLGLRAGVLVSLRG